MNRRLTNRLTILAFLTPSVFGVFLFFVLPFGVVIWYSLIDSPMNRNFVFLDNYQAILRNGSFLLAASRPFIGDPVPPPCAAAGKRRPWKEHLSGDLPVPGGGSHRFCSPYLAGDLSL